MMMFLDVHLLSRSAIANDLIFEPRALETQSMWESMNRVDTSISSGYLQRARYRNSVALASARGARSQSPELSGSVSAPAVTRACSPRRLPRAALPTSISNLDDPNERTASWAWRVPAPLPRIGGSVQLPCNSTPRLASRPGLAKLIGVKARDSHSVVRSESCLFPLGKPAHSSATVVGFHGSLSACRAPGATPLKLSPRVLDAGPTSDRNSKVLSQGSEWRLESETLGLDIRMLQRDVHALRQEFQGHRSLTERCWSISESLATNVMAGAKKLCESLLEEMEQGIMAKLEAESEARSAEIQNACANLIVAMQESGLRKFEEERERLEVALKATVNNVMLEERGAHVQDLAQTHGALLAHISELSSRLEEVDSSCSRLGQAVEELSLNAARNSQHVCNRDTAAAIAGVHCGDSHCPPAFGGKARVWSARTTSNCAGWAAFRPLARICSGSSSGTCQTPGSPGSC